MAKTENLTDKIEQGTRKETQLREHHVLQQWI